MLLVPILLILFKLLLIQQVQVSSKYNNLVLIVKLRVMFSSASSIAPPATVTCTSNDLTAFNTGGPICTVVTVATGGYNVEVTNILIGKNKYNIGMPTIVNPISTRSVADTKC